MRLRFCSAILVTSLFFSIQGVAEPRSRPYGELWETTKEWGKWYADGYKSFWRDTKRDLAPIGRKLRGIDFKNLMLTANVAHPGKIEEDSAVKKSTRPIAPDSSGNFIGDPDEVRKAFIDAVRRDCSEKESGELFLLASVLEQFDDLLKSVKEIIDTRGLYKAAPIIGDLLLLTEKIGAVINLKVSTLSENETETTHSLLSVKRAIEALTRSVTIVPLSRSNFLTEAEVREFAPDSNQSQFAKALRTLHEAARTKSNKYCKLHLGLEMKLVDSDEQSEDPNKLGVEYHESTDRRTKARKNMKFEDACRAAGGEWRRERGTCHCGNEEIDNPWVYSCIRTR